MSITRIDTTPRMSRIVEHNGTIYLCGQVAKDATKSIKEQTATTLEKVEELLNKAGSDKKHILSVTIYIRDMKDFAAMNEVWMHGLQKVINQHVPVLKLVWPDLNYS